MNANEYADTVRLYHNGDSPSGGLKFFFSARQARAIGLVAGRIYDIQRVGATQFELVPVDLVVEAPQGSMAWIHDIDPFTPTWRPQGTTKGRVHATLACARSHETAAKLTQVKLGSALAGGIRPCNVCWIPAAPLPITQPDAPVASNNA